MNEPDYSDVDGEPEILERICKIPGVKAQSWVSHEVDPGKAKRYTLYFNDRGYLVGVGTEHNDSRNRQIKPLYRDGSQIDEYIWRLRNRGVYVDLAQMWHEIKAVFLC